MNESSEDRKARLAALRRKNKQPVAEKTATTPSDRGETHIEEESRVPKNAPLARVKPEAAPILRISENETVEVVAARIQEEVFASIRNKHAQQGSARVSKKSKHAYSADLKKDIEPLVKRAQLKTDQALALILRRKYQQQLA